MAQLIVRDLDDELVRKLKKRAAEHGRSAEAEHRAILKDALLSPGEEHSFKEHLRAMPDVGRGADFERPRDRGRRVRL